MLRLEMIAWRPTNYVLRDFLGEDHYGANRLSRGPPLRFESRHPCNRLAALVGTLYPNHPLRNLAPLAKCGPKMKGGPRCSAVAWAPCALSRDYMEVFSEHQSRKMLCAEHSAIPSPPHPPLDLLALIFARRHGAIPRRGRRARCARANIWRPGRARLGPRRRKKKSLGLGKIVRPSGSPQLVVVPNLFASDKAARARGAAVESSWAPLFGPTLVCKRAFWAPFNVNSPFFHTHNPNLLAELAGGKKKGVFDNPQFGAR